MLEIVQFAHSQVLWEQCGAARHEGGVNSLRAKGATFRLLERVLQDKTTEQSLHGKVRVCFHLPQLVRFKN